MERTEHFLCFIFIVLFVPPLHVFYLIEQPVEQVWDLILHLGYFLLNCLLHSSLQKLIEFIPLLLDVYKPRLELSVLLPALAGLQSNCVNLMLWMEIKTLFAKTFEVFLTKEQLLITWMLHTKSVFQREVPTLNWLLYYTNGTFLISLGCINEWEFLIRMLGAWLSCILIAHFKIN